MKIQSSLISVLIDNIVFYIRKRKETYESKEYLIIMIFHLPKLQILGPHKESCRRGLESFERP